MKPAVASLYQAVELAQDIRPLLIGERANTNGSKKFREMLLADDFEGCLAVGLEQESKGAQVLDLCVAYAGRDEKADMTKLVGMFAKSVKIPLMIDSTTPDCIEAALKIYPSRCIINSINLEDGGTNLHKICALAKKYGTAVVALVINEKGMAMTCDEKVATARDIYDLAVNQHGLRPTDILFDMLTFTIGSGDESLRSAAAETIKAVRRIKAELPGTFTILGVSNVSFGLRPEARRILNSVFLHEAVEAGLDAAIVDTAKVIPFAQIEEEQRKICLDLIYNKSDDNKTALTTFIEYYEAHNIEENQQDHDEHDFIPEKTMHEKVLKGNKEGLEDILSILLEKYKPLDIVNNLLVPAMRHVGELFGQGQILLPFVLQSAEVMKKSVTFLEPYMEKTEQTEAVKVLLATVRGDVHDIGKNLVDIILSNNGYKVLNLGTKVPAEVIIEKAKEYNVDIVGLSGLLVKSAIVMQESMNQYKKAGSGTPILLGGAALTRKFVAQSCVPAYDRPIIYCSDAFAGLKAVRQFEQGLLTSTVYEESGTEKKALPGAKDTEIDRNITVPKAPFTGPRYVTDIDVEKLFKYINKQALFRGRWGYRRVKMEVSEYNELIEKTVEPLFEQLKTKSIKEGFIEAKIAYGYYNCYGRDNSLIIENSGKSYTLEFPRQNIAPFLCIADYFKRKEEGGDIAGFFVATIGDKISLKTKKLFEKDSFHDYMILHGFGVEITDALAEYWHEIMRKELVIDMEKPPSQEGYINQQYQGSRYGFGYPACPDLDMHKTVFELLRPQEIGVTLTENMEMVPEQSTSAIVVHHRQAKYFAV